MKIYISNSAEKMASMNLDATVEAEYGDRCVTGSILTLAHHGARGNRPCPCSIPNLPDLGITTIGVSHIDLDTIGGILAIIGQKPDKENWVRSFWKAAAQIDLMGVHKLHQIDLGEIMVLNSLNAWWAFSESSEGRVFAPRDGSVTEVDLSLHFKTLYKLLIPAPTGDRDTNQNGEFEYLTWDSPERLALIDAGKKWATSKEELEQSSYRGVYGDVLVRESDQFVNHLYFHRDQLYKVVVGFNTTRGAITVSTADPIEGFSCVEFVKSIWGHKAGGHSGIAGSPRGEIFTLADANAVAIKLAEEVFLPKD